MNREIKFRAWHKIRKEWVYIALIHGAIKFDVTQDHTVFEGDLEPWQQITGLHDKNGKEIYEGDILFGDWQNEFHSYAKGNHRVIFCKNKAGFEGSPLSESGYPHNLIGTKVEIVGNVFENPEMVK